MRAARETKHLVAQRLAVLQQEEDEHSDEEAGGDELDRRRGFLVVLRDRPLLRNHAYLEIRFFRLLLGRFGELLRGPLDPREAAIEAAEVAQFFLELAAGRRGRQFMRDAAELLVDPVAAERQAGDGESEGEDDRAGAAEERSFQEDDDR